jgi:hypothetical protein
MKKYVSPSEYYELSMPEDWRYSQEENIVSFYDATNGVGALQISSYSINKDQKINVASELAEMLTDKIGVSIQDILSKIFVVNNLAHYHFTKGDEYWNYYMLFNNGKLLLITYNCNEVDSLKEKNIVHKIVHSIIL